MVPPPVPAPSFGGGGWNSPPQVAAPVQNWAPPQVAAPSTFFGSPSVQPQNPSVPVPQTWAQPQVSPPQPQMVACHSGGYQPSIPLCQAQDTRLWGQGSSNPPPLQSPTPTAPHIAAPSTQQTFPLAAPQVQQAPQLSAPSAQAPQVRTPTQSAFPQVLPEKLPQAQNGKTEANPYLIAKPQNTPQANGQAFNYNCKSFQGQGVLGRTYTNEERAFVQNCGVQADAQGNLISTQNKELDGKIRDATIVHNVNDVFGFFVPGGIAIKGAYEGYQIYKGADYVAQVLNIINKSPLRAIAGAEHDVVLKDLPRLVATYGGNKNSWQKVVSEEIFLNSDGTSYQIHAYKNIRTGSIPFSEVKFKLTK